MPRRLTNCSFNFPCPVFCPLVNFACSNEVQNPATTGLYGFFNNTTSQTVESGETIEVSLVLDGGISSLILPAGNYSVTYFAQATVPASGTASIALMLDETIVSGSQISITATEGNVETLSQTVAFSTTTGGTLTLVNESSDSATFPLASLFVTKL